MNVQEILKRVDHTALGVDTTLADIHTLCDEGLQYGVASVCIPPCFVKRAKDYVWDMLKICTVIGFPNGYMTTAAKCFEAANAVKNGADEIDMVIANGLVKENRFEEILDEINQVKVACDGRILKVIIETCLLTEQEKIKLCEIVSQSNADFIKTSTGFLGGGATFDDIALMKQHCAPTLKIKAAGGISSLEDAEEFIRLGADRLGTSRIVKLVKEETNADTTY